MRPPTRRLPRPAPVDDAQARIELLQAQVEALQEALEGVKASMVKATPSWKGAPSVRGQGSRLVVQAARPDSSMTSASSNNPNDQHRHPQPRLQHPRAPHPPGRGRHHSRRPRLQVRNGLRQRQRRFRRRHPDLLADERTDRRLDRQPRDPERPRADVELALLSFVERAAFDDAFINTRRIGVSAGYANKAGDLPRQRRPVRRPLDRWQRSTMKAGSARRAQPIRR